MALTKKQKKGLKIFILLVLLVGGIIAGYLLCKSKETYGPPPIHSGSGPSPGPSPSPSDNDCCGFADVGVPIWDSCGHICGMSKHQGTDLNCMSNDALTLWSTVGQKPLHWKHPNQAVNHETCCGEYGDKVPIWDSCGHICGYNKSKQDMDPNGLTLWANTGSGHSGGYTASSTEAMCNSKVRYMP